MGPKVDLVAIENAIRILDHDAGCLDFGPVLADAVDKIVGDVPALIARVRELEAEVREATAMLHEIGGESSDLRELLRNYITVSTRWFNSWRNAEIEIKRRDLGLSENGG